MELQDKLLDPDNYYSNPDADLNTSQIWTPTETQIDLSIERLENSDQFLICTPRDNYSLELASCPNGKSTVDFLNFQNSNSELRTPRSHYLLFRYPKAYKGDCYYREILVVNQFKLLNMQDAFAAYNDKTLANDTLLWQMIKAGYSKEEIHEVTDWKNMSALHNPYSNGIYGVSIIPLNLSLDIEFLKNICLKLVSSGEKNSSVIVYNYMDRNHNLKNFRFSIDEILSAPVGW